MQSICGENCPVLAVTATANLDGLELISSRCGLS